MIIGGEIVQRAVAQLAGHPSCFTPVAFSFGWVGYSLNAVLLAIGEGSLMPDPDCSCILVNAKSGYARRNDSWVLGRLIRDHSARSPDHALTISLFKTDITKRPGVPTCDWVYYTGIATMIIQLGIAVIPGAVDHDWNTLIITVGGTVLALLGGALPQWRNEKWVCRRLRPGDKEVVCITRGNGFKDVVVIVSEGEGQLRLEDLAAPRHPHPRFIVTVTSVLFVLWIALLLTVAGLQNHAWYMFAIGSLGMLQNGLAAGLRRSPSSSGIHLIPLTDNNVVHDTKVFSTLVKAEKIERHVGLSLLPVFFPGGLRRNEKRWRDKRLAEYAKPDSEKIKTDDKPDRGAAAEHEMLYSEGIAELDGREVVEHETAHNEENTKLHSREVAEHKGLDSQEGTADEMKGGEGQLETGMPDNTEHEKLNSEDIPAHENPDRQEITERAQPGGNSGSDKGSQAASTLVSDSPPRSTRAPTPELTSAPSARDESPVVP